MKNLLVRFLTITLLLSILLTLLISCKEEDTPVDYVEKWFMRGEYDDIELDHAWLVQEIYSFPSETHEVRHNPQYSQDGEKSYDLVYNNNLSTITIYDTVEKAKEEYETRSKVSHFGRVVFSSYVCIRIGSVLFTESGIPIRPLLEKLNISLSKTVSVKKELERTRVRTNLTLVQIISYMEKDGYELEINDTTVYGMKEDGSCPFMLNKQRLFQLFFHSTYGDAHGHKIYYTWDYSVFCIGDDWLTILEEAEAYYSDNS